MRERAGGWRGISFLQMNNPYDAIHIQEPHAFFTLVISEKESLTTEASAFFHPAGRRVTDL